MNQELLTRLKKKLVEHHYCVTVQVTENGCRATFPSGIGHKEYTRCYTLRFKRKPGILFRLETPDEEPQEYFLDIPAYALRLSVGCDIITCCTDIYYSTKVLRLIDVDGNDVEEVDELWNLLQKPTPAKNLQFEDSLLELFKQAYPTFDKTFDDVATELNIIEGYNFIKRIMA